MKQRPLSAAIAASVLFVLPAVAQSPCPSQGITLSTSGGRLGDSWSIDMVGTANTPGIVALDVSPGPVVTPVGTLCLGLTPLLRVFPFAFNAAGSANMGGVLPPDPTIGGITFYVAAVGFDPTRPTGFAVSNGATLPLHEPRLYFIHPGVSTPFGTTPGDVAAVNMLSDNVAFSQRLASTVRDATFVRERGWLAMLLGDGTLVAFDGTTGASVLNVTLTGAPASAAKLSALPGGDGLVLMSVGVPPSPFSPGTPGSVHLVSLPSGNVTQTVPLPAGNPDAMILVPGSTTLFLRLGTAVMAFDFVSALLYPALPLPTGFDNIIDWQLAGGILYCLHSGRAAGLFGGGLPAALSAVVVSTQVVLFTNQLAMSAPVQILRAGPGTMGPSLYVYGTLAGTVTEFAQGTGTQTGSVAVGGGITAMELSALGTQWFLLCSTGACGGPALLSMAAGTMTIANVAALPPAPQPLIGVSPSRGFGKACVAAGTSAALPFLTDPFVILSPTLTLPIASSAFKVVSD